MIGDLFYGTEGWAAMSDEGFQAFNAARLGEACRIFTDKMLLPESDTTIALTIAGAMTPAGLGGCVLAHALSDTHDITLVERGESVVDPRFPVRDVGLPAVTEPHFGAGLGGSTQLWHNGLIEIDADVFKHMEYCNYIK